jgi:hypothetical protein
MSAPPKAWTGLSARTPLPRNATTRKLLGNLPYRGVAPNLSKPGSLAVPGQLNARSPAWTPASARLRSALTAAAAAGRTGGMHRRRTMRSKRSTRKQRKTLRRR